MWTPGRHTDSRKVRGPIGYPVLLHLETGGTAIEELNEPIIDTRLVRIITPGEELGGPVQERSVEQSVIRNRFLGQPAEAFLPVPQPRYLASGARDILGSAQTHRVPPIELEVDCLVPVIGMVAHRECEYLLIHPSPPAAAQHEVPPAVSTMHGVGGDGCV